MTDVCGNVLTGEANWAFFRFQHILPTLRLYATFELLFAFGGVRVGGVAILVAGGRTHVRRLSRGSRLGRARLLSRLLHAG